MPPTSCANTSASSAARLFVQLCHSSTASATSRSRTTAGTFSVLDDVLLPPSARAFHHGRRIAGRAGCSSPAGSGSRSGSIARPRIPASSRVSSPSWQKPRSLSSTAAQRAAVTQAVHNPQEDDDGNPMVLEITSRAANRLSQIMTKDENPHLALRIQVESGGCHGFQYLMSLMTLPSSASPAESKNPAPDADAVAEVAPSTTTSTETSSSSLKELGEEDTIFAYVPEGEEGATTTWEGRPKIVLDLPSLELLKGSKLDFTMELIGSQFKIVDNPYASSSCGCGTSFDIKF